MVHSGDCQLLSPVILPIAQWVHQQMAVVMVAEMGFMHGLDNTDYHSPRLTWLCPYWSILVMGWPFLHIMLLPRPLFVHLQNTTVMVFPTIAPDQVTHFTAREI